MKVVEELCQQSTCKREGTHWHPLTVESLAEEEDGEYALTVRVRTKSIHGSGGAATGAVRHRGEGRVVRLERAIGWLVALAFAPVLASVMVWRWAGRRWLDLRVLLELRRRGLVVVVGRRRGR
jgi:hypothetical protein